MPGPEAQSPERDAGRQGGRPTGRLSLRTCAPLRSLMRPRLVAVELEDATHSESDSQIRRLSAAVVGSGSGPAQARGITVAVPVAWQRARTRTTDDAPSLTGTNRTTGNCDSEPGCGHKCHYAST